MNTLKRIPSLLLLAAAAVSLSNAGAQEAGKSATIPAMPPTATIIRHADPAKAEPFIKEKKVIVLDIRTPREYAEGHIAGSTNIDFRAPDFDKKVAVLDRNKSYLVHCASGGRSTNSLEVFKKLNFRSIVHLDGGLKAWEKAGKPIEK